MRCSYSNVYCTGYRWKSFATAPNDAQCTSHYLTCFAVATPDRPIYRRCETRPHYGFTGGRSDFCVAHKQKGMVHLRNEVKSLRNKEAKRCVGFDRGTIFVFVRLLLRK